MVKIGLRIIYAANSNNAPIAIAAIPTPIPPGEVIESPLPILPPRNIPNTITTPAPSNKIPTNDNAPTIATVIPCDDIAPDVPLP